MTEILKQDQYKPLSMESQVVLMFAATNGYLDGYAVTDLRRYEHELYSFLATRHAALVKLIAEKKDIKGEPTDALKAALVEFGGLFQASAKA